MVLISVLHPLRSLRACNLRQPAYFLVSFLSCFPSFVLDFLFLSSLSDFFISISMSIFRRRVVVSSCHFLVGIYAVFSVSVATCTVYRMYLIRTCANLTFYFMSEV